MSSEKQKKISMPTSITVHANCIQALLSFYEVIAVVVSAFLVSETHLGLFDGLSVAQAVLKATSTDLMPAQFVGML